MPFTTSLAPPLLRWRFRPRPAAVPEPARDGGHFREPAFPAAYNGGRHRGTSMEGQEPFLSLGLAIAAGLLVSILAAGALGVAIGRF